MNKFLNEFKDRGYFYQCTNEDELKELFGEMRELTSEEEEDIKKEYDKICG